MTLRLLYWVYLVRILAEWLLWPLYLWFEYQEKRVCVISPRIDEIVDFILHDLHSGATLNEIIGAYDNTPRKEVITIVDKHEYRKLMDFIRKTDPKAFVTVYSVNEMRYQPKTRK